LGREKTALKVVDDQHGCPTSAADLAAGIWQMVPCLRRDEPRCWGTYHLCNQGETTWYGLAQAVFEGARCRGGDALQLERLVPISSAEYPTPARRPAYSVLNCDRVQETFEIPIRDWQAALSDTLDELLAGQTKEVL
jgi:dTDP-4-dehydrorhamnose reductase